MAERQAVVVGSDQSAGRVRGLAVVAAALFVLTVIHDLDHLRLSGEPGQRHC